MLLHDPLDSFIVEKFEKNIDFKNGGMFTKLREDDTIEFKKSLGRTSDGIGKEYLKTISGFANNAGGVIIFGIEPDHFQLVGIKSELEDYDNRFVSTTISNGLDGDFKAYIKTKKYTDKLIGFLWVDQARTKPVILKTNISSESVVEGDIYFRYPGQTRKILAADLRKIIAIEISTHTDRLFKRINQIASIGVENAAILNTLTGEFSKGNNNIKLVLDPELLNELNLIPEANIVEKDGAPGFVIRGNIHPENMNYVEKAVQVSILPVDLYKAFIKEDCAAPMEFLRTILFQSSPNFPVYCFIKQIGKSIEEVITELEGMTDTDIKRGTKKALIERLRKDNIELPIRTRFPELKFEQVDLKNLDTEVERIRSENKIQKNRATSITREIIYRHLLEQTTLSKTFLKSHTSETIAAISQLDPEFVSNHKSYVLKQIDTLLDIVGLQDSPKQSSDKSELKKVICRIDYILHRSITKH